MVCSEEEKTGWMKTSQQMGGKKRGEGVHTVFAICRKVEKKKKQLWRNNFLAIHQWVHVDPIDKLLITKSIAMNFHSCQTGGPPRRAISQRHCSNIQDTHPPCLLDPCLCSLLYPPPLQKLCCLKAKSHHQHFHFSAADKTRQSAPVTQARIDQSRTGPAFSKGPCR